MRKQKIIPPISKAKNHPPQSLHKNSLMLFGSYRNDAKTRAFFKALIGPHFHFTAFGIDWLNDRWLKGKPPTYQEFANYWATETAKRNKTKPKPKAEWAYINFIQQTKSNIPKTKLMQSWKKLQSEKAEFVKKIIRRLINHS